MRVLKISVLLIFLMVSAMAFGQREPLPVLSEGLAADIIKNSPDFAKEDKSNVTLDLSSERDEVTQCGVQKGLWVPEKYPDGFVRYQPTLKLELLGGEIFIDEKGEIVGYSRPMSRLFLGLVKIDDMLGGKKYAEFFWAYDTAKDWPIELVGLCDLNPPIRKEVGGAVLQFDGEWKIEKIVF